MKWYKYDIQYLTDFEFSKWYLLMSKDKRRRVDKFRFEEDKKRTVVGEMLARKAISEWCDTSPEDIIFGINEHGKPYAKGLAVEFNISHSNDLVICAINDNSIGVDIEKIRTVDLNIIERVCCKDELKYVLYDHSYKNFFKIWTFKEAYFKSIGTGITDFKSINYFINYKNKLELDYEDYIAHIIY